MEFGLPRLLDIQYNKQILQILLSENNQNYLTIIIFIFLCIWFVSSPSDICFWFLLQLGSFLSIHGCFFNSNKFGASCALDADRHSYVASTLEGSVDTTSLLKNSNSRQQHHAWETAGVWVYIFQIIFQVLFSHNFIALDLYTRCLYFIFNVLSRNLSLTASSFNLLFWSRYIALFC